MKRIFLSLRLIFKLITFLIFCIFFSEIYATENNWGGIEIHINVPSHTKEFIRIDSTIKEEIEDAKGLGIGVREDLLFLDIAKSNINEKSAQFLADKIHTGAPQLKFVMFELKNIVGKNFSAKKAQITLIMEAFSNAKIDIKFGLCFEAGDDIEKIRPVVDFYNDNSNAFKAMAIVGNWVNFYKEFANSSQAESILNELEYLQLEDIDVGYSNVELLAQLVKSCHNLKAFSIVTLSFNQEILKKLSEAFNSVKSLKFIDFSSSPISNGGNALADLLSKEKDLTYINLKNSGLKDEYMKKIFKSLEDTTHLSFLDFGGNNLSAKNTQALISLLKNNPNLEYLDLGRNSFENEGMIDILNSISEQSNLLSLDIKKNFVQEEGFDKLSEVIPNFKSLLYLSVKDNYLTKDSAIKLMSKLALLPNIKSIDLSNNQIGALGATEMARSLAEMKNLKFLDLSNCNIRRKGGEVIGDSLKFLINLSYLNLRENNLKESAAQRIVIGIKNSQSLRYLDLSENTMGDKGAKFITEYLSSTNSMKRLYLANIDLSAKAAKNLFLALKKHDKLTVLDISENSVDKVALNQLLNIVKGRNYFKTLILHDNMVDCKTLFVKGQSSTFECK